MITLSGFVINSKSTVKFVFRFGSVMGLMSKRLIKRDEELFVDYKYDSEKPRWYKNLEDVYYQKSMHNKKFN